MDGPSFAINRFCEEYLSIQHCLRGRDACQVFLAQTTDGKVGTIRQRIIGNLSTKTISNGSLFKRPKVVAIIGDNAERKFIPLTMRNGMFTIYPCSCAEWSITIILNHLSK
jgi:hypothetical protein